MEPRLRSYSWPRPRSRPSSGLRARHLGFPSEGPGFRRLAAVSLMLGAMGGLAAPSRWLDRVELSPAGIEVRLARGLGRKRHESPWQRLSWIRASCGQKCLLSLYENGRGQPPVDIELDHAMLEFLKPDLREAARERKIDFDDFDAIP